AMKQARRAATKKGERQRSLEFISIQETCIITGPYVEGLAKYLGTGYWQTAPYRAFVVVRSDTNTVYVFSRKRFLRLAVQAQNARSELPKERDAELKALEVIFNIHEYTRDQIVGANDIPTVRAAAVKGRPGEKIDQNNLTGVWAERDETATQFLIPEAP